MLETMASSTDHDLLITLNTKFDIFIKEWQSVRDVLNNRLNAAELRLTSLEKSSEDLAASETRKKAEESSQWIKAFDVRWKFVIGIAGAIGSIISLVLTLFVEYIKGGKI